MNTNVFESSMSFIELSVVNGYLMRENLFNASFFGVLFRTYLGLRGVTSVLGL
eukprot:CAMPEP_0172418964 /NCGR_PEP_ID=MMETSP1064-20121228/5403_1 /TAXON_ID=202472 /ORGANISM="Aulacoseira subarctica , Strain CCAP 1002/5" /LENGTH=52 /DNA_ID=CAMNT_0013158163 /DNA_START=238 /DNA_END=396 /DNA_ORIENTATION=+